MSDPEATPKDPEKRAEPALPSNDRPRCPCGYDRDHHLVSPEPKHTFWGWVLMTLGITSHPIHMAFRCRRCHQVIEETTDPVVMKRYRA